MPVNRPKQGFGGSRCFSHSLLGWVFYPTGVHRSYDLAELRASVNKFRELYDHHWILERLQYRTPAQARRDFSLAPKAAAGFDKLTCPKCIAHLGRNCTAEKNIIR
jgi:hypothetical protein